jgi:adenine-specific DNA-methyltransferase
MADRMIAKLKVVPQQALAADPAVARYELARIRPLARAWITQTPEPQRRDTAALFVRRAFDRLKDLTAPDAPIHPPFAVPFGALDAGGRSLADALGGAAAELPIAEAVDSLSSLYSVLLPSHDRSTLGAFYTPAALVNRLVELAEEAQVDWATASILDPACGGGAFLLPVAARIIEALPDATPKAVLNHLGRRLKGLELDPHAAGFAQTGLDLLLAPLTRRAGGGGPRLVDVCDTLERPPKAEFDLVIGNPPYGRLRLTAEQRQRFSRSLYGHANLYGVFTDIAVQWTRPGGVIAYLTPTSVLGGQYFAALRRLLADSAPPEAIDFVQSRRGVFEDALQETMLAVFRKGGAPEPFHVHYVTVEADGEARLTRNGVVQLPEDRDAPWLAPRVPEQSRLAQAAARMPTRLADWGYRVSTGPLVWNRFKDQLCERGGRDRHPLIWAEAVSANGRFSFRAEKRNHSPWFHAGPKDGWLIVKDPCVLVQRTTAKEQSRRLIAAELPAAFVRTHGGVVVENHLNMVRAIGRPRVSAQLMAAVLNSATLDQVYRCISGSVAVSAFELESMPLPSVDQVVPLADLLHQGAVTPAFEGALASLYAGADA